MLFSEAAEAFLSSRETISKDGHVRFVAPRTYRDYRDDLHMATMFFGQLRLDQIHAGHLRAYQMARSGGDGFTRIIAHGKRREAIPTVAGAATINDELSLVKRILTMAQLWTPQLRAMYLPLREDETELPRSLSPEEQTRFLETAKARSDVIYWYSLVALHTTFSSDEMRTIRQGDVNLSHQVLAVNRNAGKNPKRRREVPIVDGGCMWALERLIDRSVERVGEGPHLFLFPFRPAPHCYVGTQSMSRTGLRREFNDVRKAAKVPWFCLNGMRHTAITRMAEAGIPIAIIMRRAGHMTQRMSAHYTHISEQAERSALGTMESRKPVRSANWDSLPRIVRAG